MARLNQPRQPINKKAKKQVAEHPRATPNHEGGIGFKMDPKTDLAIRSMSCMLFEPTFYGKQGDIERSITKLVQDISKTDPEYVLKLAAFVRNEGRLRSVPMYLFVEAAHAIANGKFENRMIRTYAPQIIRRADELTEVIAYAMGRFGGNKENLPKQLKKGVMDSFQNFTPFQLFKYEMDRKEVKLGDVINIVHPKPKLRGFKGNVATEDEVKAIFKYLRGWRNRDKLDKGEITQEEFDKINADLDAVIDKFDKSRIVFRKDKIDAEALEIANRGDVTWEDFISHFGSNKETWTAIAEGMTYMAALRNLRNLLKHDVDQAVIKKVADMLRNPEAVKASKQFPYRFFSALKALEGQDKHIPKFIYDALEDALMTSVVNLPKLPGRTAIFTDVSGSMQSPVAFKPMNRRGYGYNSKEPIQRIEIAALMSMMAYSFSDDPIIGAFGTEFAWAKINPRDSVFTNARALMNLNIGWSTNAYLSINALLRDNTKVDRILIFSDEQTYDSQNRGWRSQESLAAKAIEYRKKINPDVRFYVWNLCGYGQSALPQDDPNTILLGGFSDSIFQFMQFFEQDPGTIEKLITGELKMG